MSCVFALNCWFFVCVPGDFGLEKHAKNVQINVLLQVMLKLSLTGYKSNHLKDIYCLWLQAFYLLMVQQIKSQVWTLDLCSHWWKSVLKTLHSLNLTQLTYKYKTNTHLRIESLERRTFSGFICAHRVRFQWNSRASHIDSIHTVILTFYSTFNTHVCWSY